MPIAWKGDDLAQIESAMRKHPIESGRCSAVARAVYALAKPFDASTQGEQIRPTGAARFVVPKHDSRPRWASHTLVRTHQHRVDVLTGAGGCEEASI